MGADDFILGPIEIGKIIPLTTAGKIEIIMELLRDTDEDGNPIEPLLTKEEILKILETE